MKKKVEVWPKGRRLSKAVEVEQHGDGCLTLVRTTGLLTRRLRLTKAETRRLAVFLSGRYKD